MKEEDFKNYFLRDNRGAYIDFIDPNKSPMYVFDDTWKYMSVYFGPFIWDNPNWNGKPTVRRPIIDNKGNQYWVTPDFTGTCEQFPWQNVRNLEFAQSVKLEQSKQPYFGASVISCSCKCRIEGKDYSDL